MGRLKDQIKDERKRHSDRHHPIPTSRMTKKYRGEKYRIIYKWLKEKLVIENVLIKMHEAFHVIFGNYEPEEQLQFLKKLCDSDGILNANVYIKHKKAFDLVFGGNTYFSAMVEVLKKWDIPEEIKIKYPRRLAIIRGMLNDEIVGGISLKKLGLE